MPAWLEVAMAQNMTREQRIEAVIEALQDKPGPLLPILHGIQDELGYIPPEAVPTIAARLNLSRAEVHGVIGFYHYFRQTPPGRHVIYLCRSESCQAMQATALEAHARQRLGIDYHETSTDQAFTLEPVYCLGQCACSPAIMVDQEVYGRVTPERFDEILETVRAQS